MLTFDIIKWKHQDDTQEEEIAKNFQNFSRTGSVPATQSIKVGLRGAIFAGYLLSVFVRGLQEKHTETDRQQDGCLQHSPI